MTKKQKQKPSRLLDMREYIQWHLDLYDMGRLVTVKGPERGGRDNDQAWYQLQIVYRQDPNASHFDDGRIDVYLGYNRKGGYWNRRNIRVEIEKEAKKLREAATAKRVWARAQLSITDGRDSDGAFAL